MSAIMYGEIKYASVNKANKKEGKVFLKLFDFLKLNNEKMKFFSKFLNYLI